MSERSSGAPGRIRTSDLLVRSQALYPAELRAHIALLQLSKNNRWERCDQPLGCNRSRLWLRGDKRNLFDDIEPGAAQ
jgi:hypothetical protein